MSTTIKLKAIVVSTKSGHKFVWPASYHGKATIFYDMSRGITMFTDDSQFYIPEHAIELVSWSKSDVLKSQND
jgi:hypothetical protein